MRNNSVPRRALLPLALVLALFSFGPSAAQAWTLTEVSYGSVALWPNGQQGSSSVTTPRREDITGNIAIYEGAGTIGVRQHTYDVTSGFNRESRGNNAPGNALKLTPYYGHILFPGSRDNSPWKHTFPGVYHYSTP